MRRNNRWEDLELVVLEEYTAAEDIQYEDPAEDKE